MSDWDFQIHHILGDTVVWHGLSMDIHTIRGSQEQNLTVYADVLTINGQNGSVRLPGKNVYIFAREVRCIGNAIIDASGADITESERVNAGQLDNRTADKGADGKDGDAGKAGNAGGNVRIFAESITGPLTVNVSGGRGGRGQDGGDGESGPTPPPAGDIDNHVAANNINPGRRGGNGGNAGRGGAGGRGGDAGTAEINVVQSVQPIAPQLQESHVSHAPNRPLLEPLAGNGTALSLITPQVFAKGGAAGDNGKTGNAGLPGLPGLGGRVTEDWDTSSPHHGEDIHHHSDHGRNPNNGGYGSPGLVPPPFAPQPSGHDAASSNPVKQIDYRTLGYVASLPQCLMVLHNAETDYLNSLYSQCSAGFSWLERLTTAYSDDTTSINKEWLALRDRVLALLAQMSVGLDFYGLPKNFAPIVDQSVYEELIKQLIPIAKDIQSLHEKYTGQQATKEEKQSALEAIKSKALALNQLAGLEVSGLEDSANRALLEANNLTTALNSQVNGLQIAEDSFIAAVQAAAGDGCDVMNTLIFVGSVVAVAAGQYEAIGSVIAGAKGSVSVIKKIKGAIQLAQIAGRSLNDIKEAYRKFSGPLRDNTSGVKLVVHQEDYDKQINEFTKKMDEYNTPESRHYKELGLAYIRTAQSRNSKLMDYTKDMQKKARLEAEITQREEEIRRVDAVVAALQDPALVDCEVFVRGLLMQTKKNLIRSVYMFRKALEYWSLNDMHIAINSNTVEEIADSYGSLLFARTQSLESRNSDAQFTLDFVLADHDLPPGTLGISLPDEFKEFRVKKELTFSIPVNHPAFRRAWAAVKISELSVTVDGVITDDGIVTVELTQCGTEQFVDPKRRADPKRILEYSHQPRTFTETNGVAANTETAVNVRGEDRQFAYLSPFSVWRLAVSDEANASPRLDGLDAVGNPTVNQIKLHFTGRYTPFS